MTIKRGTVAAVLMFSMIAIPDAFGQDHGNVPNSGPAEARKALVVVDSRGQVVGPLVFPGTNALVSNSVTVGGGQLDRARGPWHTLDCKGVPHLDLDAGR